MDHSTTQDLAGELEKLYELRQKGILTEEEFVAAKEKVLAPSDTSSNATHSSRGRHSSRSSRGSHSRSSSSSSDGGFIVPQRTGVWRVTKGGLTEYSVGINAEDDIEVMVDIPGVTPTTEVSPMLPKPDDASITPDESVESGKTGRPRHRRTQSGSMRASFGPKERPAYGTFDGSKIKSARHGLGVRLLAKDRVFVQYFNSKGKSSTVFKDVVFEGDFVERTPHFFPVGGDPQFGTTPDSAGLHRASTAQFRSSQSHDSVSMSSRDSDELALHYDWYWVDFVGRDESKERAEYNKEIKQLTEQFRLCPSLLLDREHNLIEPQFVAAATNRHQFLVCLRVATPKINLRADSVTELTNRWILVVDRARRVVITLHRWDTVSMATLRAKWGVLMQQEIAFEEFLLKIIDDATTTFNSSLDVHSVLLDQCEAKLLVKKGRTTAVTKKISQERKEYEANSRSNILGLFDTDYESRHEANFLQQLMSPSSSEFDREELNQFLYHLHRRAGVQYRMLNITQPVLLKAFTTFRLCSKDRSQQLGGYCSDLASKALEVRDNAKHLLDMHINLVNFHTNELMALLTRVSLFFAPLEFLAAVYGMNFDYMPELHMRHGYFMFWGLCAFILVFLYSLVRKHLQ